MNGERKFVGINVVQTALMLLAGILIGLHYHPSLWLSMALLAIGLSGGIFFARRGMVFELDQLPKKLARGFICLAVFGLGMLRASISTDKISPGDVENYANRRVENLTGYLIAPPVVSNSRTSFQIQLDSVQQNQNNPDEGRLLLVYFDKFNAEEFHYGDRLSVNGTIILPPDARSGFSYRDYLENHSGIKGMINNPEIKKLQGFTGNRLLASIYQLRSLLINRVFELFPKPESALMAGILLGDESKITSDIDRDFQKTGTSHIIMHYLTFHH